MLFYNYKEYAAIFRNHQEIPRFIYPFQWMEGGYKLLSHNYFRPKAISRTLVGEDAYNNSTHKNGKFNLLVLVVGETARNANQYYGGYNKNTNKHSMVDKLIYFSQAKSCATYTAKSIPCMFSPNPYKTFEIKKFNFEDNLLDILKRAWLFTTWIENNSGCKGVCRHTKTIYIPTKNPTLYNHKTCFDEITVQYLKQHLQKNINQDQVIIIHLIGSHGPNYHLRYPREHAYFKPECQIKDIQHCSSESLINTYDNTILYTDYVIHKIIALLKANNQLNTGLIYLSDHGESLGEYGLFLHGFPYKIAPKEQKEIPWMIWISSNMQKEILLDLQCLQTHGKKDFISHDHLFHSVLSLMNIKTHVYNPKLDIFHACKTNNFSQA